MCWSLHFGFPGSKNHKHSASNEKRTEKRNSRESSQKRTSRGPAAPRSPRREREEHRRRSHHHHDYGAPTSRNKRPALNQLLLDIDSRSARQPEWTCASQETLLHHPKRTSQMTLRGRGAKRDPPPRQLSQSKTKFPPEPSRGWTLFAPYPPRGKCYQRSHQDHRRLEAATPSHRSSRKHHSATTTSQTSPNHAQSQTAHQNSHQQEQQFPRSHLARSRTSNTAAQRMPDRRFAVLAATNQALENVRREAFAQSSPPPRRERLRRYEGVALPTSQMPFDWDCVSSSQISSG